MSNINYKAEVLKIHPKAFCAELEQGGYVIAVFGFGISLNIISEHMFSKNGAWQNAYEKL